MPLGNLTSQFFANLYLNELDQYIKHNLKAKYYIRYVDDFIILHENKQTLKIYKINIEQFLNKNLNLELHPDKSQILKLNQGVTFLGFKIFSHHKIIKKRNIKGFKRKLNLIIKNYNKNLTNYDEIYDFLEGWCAYTKNANTYNLRTKILSKIETKFKNEISSKEINRLIKQNTFHKN